MAARALIEAFPKLAAELAQSLRDSGREALAEQIESAIVTEVRFDDAANAAYITVEPSRDLNLVEKNIISVRHGETITVDTQFWTVIDTDNFDRISGIEILDPGELKAELRYHARV